MFTCQAVHDHVRAINATTEQMLSNAAQSSNDTFALARKHADLAADRLWNLDEVSAMSARNSFFREIVASVVTEVLKATNKS